VQTKTVIRLPAVKGKTTLSKSAIYRLEAEGKFPKRVRLGENSTGWYEEEIQEWLASRPRVADVAKAR
jgi:prophage regulatory protein